MKRIINLILALVFMCMTTLTASATEYITDVMLIGAYAQADYNALVAKYTSQGWKATNWDLNKGIAWGSGDAILLLYKTAESTDGFNHEYITDFYIQNRSAAKTTQTLNFMGRTYDLVPVSDDSDSHFKGQYGDLNSHTGASTDPMNSTSGMSPNCAAHESYALTSFAAKSKSSLLAQEAVMSWIPI